MEVVCREGPRYVLELAAFGASFTRCSQSGALHLTREGGHSARRIVHAAGGWVQQVLGAGGWGCTAQGPCLCGLRAYWR